MESTLPVTFAAIINTHAIGYIICHWADGNSNVSNRHRAGLLLCQAASALAGMPTGDSNTLYQTDYKQTITLKKLIAQNLMRFALFRFVSIGPGVCQDIQDNRQTNTTPNKTVDSSPLVARKQSQVASIHTGAASCTWFLISETIQDL